jgi:glycine betaine/choline ABC-type transport system substrate-binding protein
MRQLNYLVDVEHREPARVARDFLDARGPPVAR